MSWYMPSWLTNSIKGAAGGVGTLANQYVNTPIPAVGSIAQLSQNVNNGGQQNTTPNPNTTGVLGNQTQNNNLLDNTGSGLQQYKTPVVDRINQVLNAYNMLDSNTNNYIQDQLGRANQGYDQQTKQLNDSYKAAANQLGGVYDAKGGLDSSYYANAMDTAKNTYNDNNSQLIQGRNDTLAGLGKFGVQQHQGVQSALSRYTDMLNNLGQYDTAEAAQQGAGQVGLQNLNNTLQDTLSSVQNQNAGLGTNADFISQLQKFAPQANQGANQLAEQLQKIVVTGAPIAAKNALAQGIIKQSQLTDPNAQGYWNNYFQQLINGQA